MSYYCISHGFYEISPALGKKEQEEFDRLAECYYWRVVDGGRHLAPMQENVWHIWDDFEHLMETFFERKGYLLNGVVVWKGENFYDIGECRVENNERNYFYGKELFEEVRDLSLRFLASDSEEDFPFALRGLQDTPARRRPDRYYYTEAPSHARGQPHGGRGGPPELQQAVEEERPNVAFGLCRHRSS